MFNNSKTRRFRPSSGFLGLLIGFFLIGGVWPPTFSAFADAVGDKTVAVILFNFQNHQIQVDSVANVRSNFFTAPDSITAFYKEFSYNKLNLTGEVFGWYTIGADWVGENICPTTEIFNEYVNQAYTLVRSALGRDLIGEYQYLVFVFPRVGNCAVPPSFHGLALGANQPGLEHEVVNLRAARVVLVNASPERYKWVAAHELGHHLGFAHNNAFKCQDTAPPLILNFDLCRAYEYADLLGVMGSADLMGVPLVVGSQRWSAGWVADNEVVTIEESGGNRQTVSLKPISSAGASPKLARVLLPGFVNALYLEFNPPLDTSSRWGRDFYSMLGLDAGVRIYTSAADKADMDITNPTGAFFAATALFDADPASITSQQYEQLVNFSPHLINNPPTDWLLGSLRATLTPASGGFSHEGSGVAIYTRNVSSAGADVVVEFLAPKISWPEPGQRVSGTVNVQLSLYGQPGENENLLFYIDGQMMQTFTPVPNTASGLARYDYSWNTADYATGDHTITALVKDGNGNEKLHRISVVVTRDPADASSPPPPPPPELNILEAIFQLFAQIIQGIFQLFALLFGGMGAGGGAVAPPATVAPPPPPPPPPPAPSPVLDLAPVQPEEALGFTYSLRSPPLRTNLDNIKDNAGNILFNVAVGYSGGAATDSGLSSITVRHNDTQIYRCPPGVLGFEPLVTAVYECIFSYPRSQLQIGDAIQVSMVGAARVPLSVPPSYALASLRKEYQVVSLAPTGGGREVLPDVPTITSVSPSSGPNSTVITITGAGFTPTNNRVSLGYGEVVLSSPNSTTLTTVINVPNLPPPGVLGPTFPEMRLRIYVENAKGRTAVPGEFVVRP